MPTVAAWRLAGRGRVDRVSTLIAVLSDAERERVEAAVERALDTGDTATLNVLGYGEISVTLGWPAAEPRWACKRLPPFADAAAFAAYRALVDEYVARLRSAGVGVVETEVRALDRADGSVVGFVVQPVLDVGVLGPAVLGCADPAAGHPLVDAIVASVLACTDGATGIDAQITNWAWVDDEALNLDVNTPLLYDEHGRPRLDVGLFVAALPWVLRATQRRAAARIAARWRAPRWALLDLAMNLYKDGLEAWIPVVLEAANPRLDVPIDPAGLRRQYAREAALWVRLHRLKRVDRWWQRTVRRRRYELMIPEHTDYAR